MMEAHPQPPMGSGMNNLAAAATKPSLAPLSTTNASQDDDIDESTTNSRGWGFSLPSPLAQDSHIMDSYENLSRLQKMLILGYISYLIVWRMAGHTQLLRAGYKHFYDHWHLLAFWSDLFRLIVCLSIEVWSMSQAPGGQTDPFVTSFWKSFRNGAFSMAFSFLLSWGHEFSMKQATSDIPYAIAEVGTFGVLPAVAFLSMISRLKYSYTHKQWICMMAVVLGAYIIQVHGIKSEHDGFGSRLAGILFICMGMLTESLFAVFTEEVLKTDLLENSESAPSLWMRGVQFSLTGVIVRPLLDRDWTNRDVEDTAMTFATYLLAPLTATAILAIFALLKHVTAVHEKLTLFFAYAIVNLLDYWLFGQEMTRTWVLYLGTTIMITSVWLFGTPMIPDWLARWTRSERYQEVSSTATAATLVA